MKVIELTKGFAAIVDDEDYGMFAQHRWYMANIGYAMRRPWKAPCQYLHRLIAGAKKGEFVDHLNGNKLDCRRCNLRIATRSQNQMNRGVQRNNSLGLKGISFDKRRGKFYARIVTEGVKTHLGTFSTKEEAKIAYVEAALAQHKAFARLN